MKYTYATKVTKKGTFRIRKWKEIFKDESTGETVEVDRSEPIKLNGEKLIWIPNSVIKKMSKEEKKRILI
jgi:hypothetical protein